MRITVVRAFGIVIAFAAGLPMSHAAPAVKTSSRYCSAPAHNRITTCFLDLTKTSSSKRTPTSAALSDGIFRKPVEPGATLSSELQPFVPVESASGLQSLDVDDKTGSLWSGSTGLGDIATVTVCDGGRTPGSHCEYYQFLLDTNQRASGPDSRISLDKYKVFTDLGPDTWPFLRNVRDRGRSGGGPVVPVLLTNSSNPAGNPADSDKDNSDKNQSDKDKNDKDKNDKDNSDRDNSDDLKVLIPVSNVASLWDDSYVYVYSTYTSPGTQCNDSSSPDSPCATSSGPTQATDVPLPSTALLLGIGLAGLVRIRRRRSPDHSLSR